MADQLKPPRLFDENFQGTHKPTHYDFVVPVTVNGFQNLSTYTWADPKHDVHGYLLLCAISLRVLTHLHALGVEVVSQLSPQVFRYHSRQAQRR
jgi:hypothetical protein